MIKTKLFIFYGLLIGLLPNIILAGGGPAGEGGAGGGPAGEGVINVTFRSPINVTSVEDLILAILNVLVILATPIIVLMIIYSGFLYVTARGNAEQIRKATTALTYAVIGGILIIGATAITGIIRETVQEFRTEVTPISSFNV